MNRYAIIVAGGSGTRMGAGTPKQFLLLDGMPLLMHSIRAFSDFDPEITIVVSLLPSHFQTWRDLCREYSFTVPHQLVPGGETRFMSVKNGLQSLPDKGFVAIHDAVRPLISGTLISRLFIEAQEYSSAIPAIPVNETIRQIQPNGDVALVDRSNLRIIQTPQVFDLTILQDAYNQEYNPAFTDDGAVLESRQFPIHLTEGEHRNLKITYPTDLAVAEALLAQILSRKR